MADTRVRRTADGLKSPRFFVSAQVSVPAELEKAIARECVRLGKMRVLRELRTSETLLTKLSGGGKVSAAAVARLSVEVGRLASLSP
jgi:hypothetical protein